MDTRVTILWNGLSRETVAADNVKSPKSGLEKDIGHLKNDYLFLLQDYIFKKKRMSRSVTQYADSRKYSFYPEFLHGNGWVRNYDDDDVYDDRHHHDHDDDDHDDDD